MAKWTTADIPDQTGRVAVITGANTGLGYETALALADHGAHVVLAVRNLDKGKDAAARITAQSPGAEVALQELDLTSLDSIRAAAEQLRSEHDRIDLLINNAGVMYTPKSTTKDGFELQFGTNHLGHFAFTGLLLDRLLPVAGSRVMTVSSVGHRIRADIHFDDLQWEHSYSRVAAYGQAKKWYPFAVEEHNPPFDMTSPVKEVMYSPLEKAEKGTISPPELRTNHLPRSSGDMRESG